MKPFIYILISCILGSIMLAETSTASICDTKETIVFFGNGAKAIKKDAYKAKESIKKSLKTKLPAEEFEALGFDVAYNDTHTLPLDLLESTIQILAGNTSRFWRLFWGLEIIPDWFGNKITLLSTVLDYSALLTTDSLKNHVRTYKTAIAEGKKVILVAHSQGNFFGNQAYTLLNSRERQSFGMISVANVDSNVLGDASDAAPYTTLVNDKVILAIIAAQLALPTSPKFPNTENLDDSEDLLGHSFIQAYMMAGSVSANQVIDDIIAELDSLATPYQIVDPGVITVSLTWENEPDMDLHVYEPNGTHVYWENREGFSGKLDRDDRSAPGTEHYTVPTCDTLESGVYRIGLDYFKGYGPEIGTIQVNAGILSRTFEVRMGSEYYGDPDYPERIAHIWVRPDESGALQFNIFPD